MPALSPEKWRALSPYLDEALQISAEQREAWLASLADQNPALAAELRRLLTEHDALTKEGFLRSGPEVALRPPSLVGHTAGAYTLESLIGQGGMGTVWLAGRSDGRFEGKVAVKFLHIALLGGAGEQRFKREGSFLARLAHPNIAHLIDAGVSATGQPYLILEHVGGQHIDAHCNDRGLGLEARIRLFLDVLAAVAHAHANLIVHRDLKPSNVLVTRQGHVKLLDFGIAKLLEDEAPQAPTALTREGGSALSLAYAAPEQVAAGPVTTATDVYSLGTLLYLLLTGKHPAESALHSPARLMKAILEAEPPRASEAVGRDSKLSRALRGDLDTILGKTLKKNPAERYATVTALADDLRRYLRHQTISARPDTLAYRAKTFVRRNQMVVAFASVAALAMLAGGISTLIQARTARIERDFALRQLSRAEAINDLNSFVLSDAAPSGKPFTVNDLLARAEQLVERQGGDDANRVDLLLSIGRQYTTQGEYAKVRRLLKEAYTLARALPERSTRARTACALAQASRSESDVPAAETLVREGLNELPQDAQFALDRVFCLQRGSEIAARRGESHDAVTRAQAAERALRQSPFRSELLELDNLMILASAYRSAGQAHEAKAAFEQASARLSALGRDDTQRATRLFNHWGEALRVWGQPIDSERMLRRVIALGEYNPAEAAKVAPMVLVNYARSLTESGRLDEAAAYAERAHAMARTEGDENAVYQSLLVRACIYRSRAELERAAQMLSEAEPILQRDLPAGHIAFASLAFEKALIAQARGDARTALNLVDQAVATAEQAVQEDREGADWLKSFLVSRSEIQLQLGHQDEAAEDARRALKMLEAQPGTFSSNLGRAYKALGRALQAQGKPDQARAALRSAVEHLQSALGSDHRETREALKLAEL